jgi:hypothetical protein
MEKSIYLENNFCIFYNQKNSFRKFNIINIKIKKHEFRENVIIELVLQRFVAQQVLIIDPPPNV